MSKHPEHSEAWKLLVGYAPCSLSCLPPSLPPSFSLSLSLSLYLSLSLSISLNLSPSLSFTHTLFLTLSHSFSFVFDPVACAIACVVERQGQCHAENDEDKSAIVCLEKAVENDPYNLDVRRHHRCSTAAVMVTRLMLCVQALVMLGVSYVNEMNVQRALRTLQVT